MADAVLQGLAFEQLHGEKRVALVLAHFVNGADVGMIDGGGGARFALETLDGRAVARYFVRQKF